MSEKGGTGLIFRKEWNHHKDRTIFQLKKENAYG